MKFNLTGVENRIIGKIIFEGYWIIINKKLNEEIEIKLVIAYLFVFPALMPMWIFSLGHLIFTEGKMMVPYSRIGTIALGLIVPLALGLLIQKFFPRVSKFMVRIMKPFSALLIIFIVVFAFITNYYLFQLFSWQVSAKH